MSLERSAAVGVEIAASGATAALINGHGRVLHRCYAKTLRGRPAIATLEPYMRAIDTLLNYARAERLDVYGVGVSVPGSLDAGMRRPQQVPALPALSGFPLADFLETHYRLPTRLYVDVDAALLGEQRFGAGKNFKRLLFLNVNAVVGAAFVIDGQLDRSCEQYVGHVCHISISSAGSRCSCGKRGCINTLISMGAIQKMIERALRRGEETSLTQRLLNREGFSLQLLAEEAERGDSVAVQVYGEVSRWLGATVARYVDLFDPNVLILGGGVSGGGELLLARMRGALTATSSSSRVCSMVEVVHAYLGNDAAVIGAAASLL